MGFSWSSFLAQSTLLQCLAVAGFDKHHMLADDKPPPANLDLAAALATDDVMIFARCDKRVAQAAVTRVDAAIIDCGIEP